MTAERCPATLPALDRTLRCELVVGHDGEHLDASGFYALHFAGTEVLPPLDGLAHHRPVRPDWSCRDCGLDWPCPGGQAGLLVLLPDSRALAVLLGAALNDYEGDLVESIPRESERPSPLGVLTRFLSWLP